MAAPDLLYHYTTLESLAHILKRGAFRFTRIDRLNDPLEGLCSDVKKARKHIFVSSWTANSDDQIPMWKMYTGDMSGVRIRLPSTLFSSSLRHEEFDMGVEGTYLGCRCEPFAVNCSYLGIPLKIEYVFGPLEILYENSEEEVIRRCSGEQVAPTGITVKRLNLNNLGDAKVKHWRFEHEWRYRVYATPNGFPVLGSADVGISILLPGIPIEYIDVPINRKCLGQMEIMIGPRGTEAQEIIAASLISEYAPDATIARSKIKITRAT